MSDTPPLPLVPVALARTPFGQKFGIPRQSGIAPAAQGVVELLPPFDRAEAVRGLDGYTHIWLIFIFHGTRDQGWHPTVRPPRLGGNQRLGVFASRSTFRPNALGLSCVRLDRVEAGDDGVRLHVSGLDLLDGTPIVDIKPYIPFADCHPEATAALVPDAPAQLPVRFSPQAEARCPSHLRDLVVQTLAQDPRPAYQDDDAREYGMKLQGFNIRFRVNAAMVEVLDCAPIRHADGETHHGES